MTDKPSQAAKQYKVTQAREISGAYRQKGEILSMHPLAAKYYMPPLGTGLALAKPQKDPKTEPAAS